MFAGLLALATASAFAGAALYVNVAEQPARLGLDDKTLLAEWKRSYARGFTMPAILVVVCALLGQRAADQAVVRSWIQRNGGLNRKLILLRGRQLSAIYRHC
jgi:hypothetical protein